jgi:DNA-binding NarL/FixJ family response regulator
LTEIKESAGDDGVEAALSNAKTLDLDVVVTNLLTRLSFDTRIPDNAVAKKSISAQPVDMVEPLTPRELEILQLIADGLTNPEIAETSFITVGTVKAHINSIYSKLAVQNRVQAVTRAQELGLV